MFGFETETAPFKTETELKKPNRTIYIWFVLGPDRWFN